MLRHYIALMLVVLSLAVWGQCPPGPLGTGFFLDKPAGCATFGLDIMFTPQYSQLEDDSEIFIDWGDGNNTTVNTGTSGGQTGVIYNTPIPHTYTEAETSGGCVYTITAYVTGPNNCYTQEETTVTTDIVIWNTDNFGDGGGGITPSPVNYTVCAGTTATIQYDDLSPWNCTDVGVTASTNNKQRWTQWIYGITNTISGGSATVDGSPVTPGVPVNGTVFTHTTMPVLDPQAPGNTSLEVFIPSTASVGEQFSVRLANWNQCNPYPANDSVFADAIITVVAPPNPSFIARDGMGGPALTEFCINEDVYFDNQTGGGFTFDWEFYDGPDPDNDTQIGSSTATHPSFQWTIGGQKFVRLTASDGGVAALCEIVYEDTILLTPDAVAQFEFYDATFTSIINPDFCQTGADVFTVGFRDNTVDVPNTEYRYEFYDEADVLISTEPTNGSYLPDPVPDFTRMFSVEEYVRVRLVAQSTAGNFCSSFQQDTVFVYGEPIATFDVNEVCEGVRTSFSAITDQFTGFTTRVNNEEISQYEWDFSYDGVTFNTELIRTDDNPFNWFIDGSNPALGVEPATSVAGDYTVALRTTSLKGMCTDLFTSVVRVNRLPGSNFTASAGAICPGESIDFSNTSNNDTLTVSYKYQIDHLPTGFSDQIDLVGSDTSYTFINPDDSSRNYQIVLEAETVFGGCITNSAVTIREILFDEDAGFDDPTFSFLDPNCSPYSSTLFVDANTVALSVDQYNWDIIDSNDLSIPGFPTSKISTDPDFHELDYQVINATPSIQSYQIILEAIKSGICIANDTFDIVVSPLPDPGFIVVQDDECEEAVFTVVADQEGLTYDWQFDPAPDNVIDNDDEQVLTYLRELSTGSDIAVQITLTVTNLASCQSAPEVQNFVVEKRENTLTADFNLSADTLTFPDTVVTITNTSTTSVNYDWDFGDGDISNAFGPFDQGYSAPGSYDILLTVSDAYCEEMISKSFVLLPAIPVIDFEADTLQGCAPLTVNFSNLSQSAEPGQYIWQFGDGNFSLDDNATNTYTTEGIYTVLLRGENAIGESATSEKVAYIEVFSVPSSNFIADQQDNCEEVVFSLQAVGSGLTYFWEYNPAPDSLMDNGGEQVAIYTREGVTGADIPVEIRLMTISGDSCESTTTIQNFTVENRNDDLVADFILSSNSVQYPVTSVSIINTSTSGANYLWDFGDGQQSSETGSFSHSFSDPGNYTISLTVSDDYCSTENTELFSVIPLDPVIDFEADTLEGCTPLTVNFTNLSTSAVSGSYFWEFGDGNISREDNPSHTYVAQGNYTITLRGENSAGVQVEEEKIDYITIVGTPTSSFIVDKQDNCEDVTFFIQAVAEGLSYEWEFDPSPDDQVGTENEVVLTYDREPLTGPDLFVEMSSIVSASGNCVGAQVIQRDTVENRNQEIVSAFTMTDDTLKLPDSTVFLANFSTQGDGINYFWDFGNGESSDAVTSFTYYYTEPGSYQIFLTVTDEYCQSVATDLLVVFPPDPIINFVADTLEGCSPLTVAFTNLSENVTPGAFSWDFGDGGISVADQPIYTYFSGGDFTVRLRGRNEVGVTDELERENYIQVTGAPLADFASSPKTVYIPDQKVFFRNLSENGFSYSWDFGDGVTSTEEEPQHAYIEEGVYDVSLTVLNELGCKDSLYRESEIVAIKGGTVNSPNAFTPSQFGPTGGELGNGNGEVSTINDVFLPEFEGVVKFRMLIYNKWGQLLFESKSVTRGWDGYYKGKLAPAGVYVYKLELGYNDGSTAVEVGDLTLIR